MKNIITFLFFCSFVLGACTSEYELHTSPPTIEIPLPGGIKNPGGNQGTHYGNEGVNVDVLVVLDTSCSMLNDTEPVASIPDIVTDLQDRPEIRWRLGILAADPTRLELFHEIDLRDDDAYEQMEDAVDTLMQTSIWWEEPLGTIIRFYDEELWFRDVFTIFVVITDEPDQSSITATDFDQIWPTNYDMVSVVADEDFVPGCYAKPAPGLLSLSTKHIDICDRTPWSIFGN